MTRALSAVRLFVPLVALVATAITDAGVLALSRRALVDCAHVGGGALFATLCQLREGTTWSTHRR